MSTFFRLNLGKRELALYVRSGQTNNVPKLSYMEPCIAMTGLPCACGQAFRTEYLIRFSW